jgi:hypothetical protein
MPDSPFDIAKAKEICPNSPSEDPCPNEKDYKNCSIYKEMKPDEILPEGEYRDPKPIRLGTLDSQPFDREYVKSALKVATISEADNAPMAVMTYVCEMCYAEIERLESKLSQYERPLEPPEDPKWIADIETVKSNPLAQYWHSAYRKAQNSWIVRQEQNKAIIHEFFMKKNENLNAELDRMQEEISKYREALIKERADRLQEPRYEVAQRKARRQLEAEYPWFAEEK